MMRSYPAIISEILAHSTLTPKWGADDEDSKTPLRADLISAGENLSSCFDGDLAFTDPKNQKTYTLESEKLSLPIKRFPGLALPCLFLFYHDNPIPLHLYDFALHLFRNWHHGHALAYYVPKLETEEEADYIHHMVQAAEQLIQKLHPEYILGSIRLFIVLENPRAIFRVNEIMDALHPYFAGASLGWHDYLASTARLFKEDGNYRIPVKADPNIVIKYIKASHDLLSEVVGSRGGIKIGGMYGVLPIDNELTGASFQLTLKGFIKDVVTQLKRNLSGFWVAHPDFVRMGLALVESFKLSQKGDASKLEAFVRGLLNPEHQEEILAFIRGPDLLGLPLDHPMYPRYLLVADIKESNFISNSDPEEIRYNVFQSLQYLTDWLSGNGCVALPAEIAGVPVRVMDDLATAERSRWEVWHEIHHGRISRDAFLKIVHEEMRFIRKDLSDGKKIVQVKYDSRTEKWYPIALKLMVQLMTAQKPVEFATELLLPFTLDLVRNSSDPWREVQKIDAEKYSLENYVDRFNDFFSICGTVSFAREMAGDLTLDLVKAERLIQSFTLAEILEAASFHGDIGENKKTLDEVAAKEQALVSSESEDAKANLRSLGAEYLAKFGFKYLVSAQGKSAFDIFTDLSARLKNSSEEELNNARLALWEISRNRLKEKTEGSLGEALRAILKKHDITGAMLTVTTAWGKAQTITLGERIQDQANVTGNTWFEIASLSKTLASAFAIEYFKKRGVSLHDFVNPLLAQTKSSFRLKSMNSAHPEWAEEVTIAHLMKHAALNMHYVNGVPADQEMPNVSELVGGSKKYGYVPVEVQNKPGTAFQYSGGGFMVLEHLIESLEKAKIQDLTKPFFAELQLTNLSFEQKTISKQPYASGYLDTGRMVEGSRKMFPAFAAGAMGTSSDVSAFLSKLTEAYHSIEGSGPISHDTAVEMLHSHDHSSQEFMGVNIGLGVFIADAGSNRLAIHQGANDGFRCLYVHCFDGPDTGAGFVILCNADKKGVLFVAETAQLILKELSLQGVDPSKFKTEFDTSKVPQEEIVNLGYKNLVFGAFTPDLPEAIVDPGPVDPDSAQNLVVGAKILKVTNQRFALAKNLISATLPVFDTELYGLQGKIMDSWESVRHNFKPIGDAHDSLTLELKKSSTIRYATLSTQFHNGNHPEAVKLEAREGPNAPWIEILPKINLAGHSEIYLKLPVIDTVFSQVKVSMYPDGGLSRLGLFSDGVLDPERFEPIQRAKPKLFKDPVPHAKKPLTPKFKTDSISIDSRMKALKPGQFYDIASAAYGGKIVHASNEHYGPAAQIISPYPALNMFDGFESARSRIIGHHEEVTLGFAKAAIIRRIEVDFKFFKNNNPNELMIEGLGKAWTLLVPRTHVKKHAGNQIAFEIHSAEPMSQIKVLIYPDGGINRVRVLSSY
jgi:malate synthase